MSSKKNHSVRSHKTHKSRKNNAVRFSGGYHLSNEKKALMGGKWGY